MVFFAGVAQDNLSKNLSAFFINKELILLFMLNSIHHEL